MTLEAVASRASIIEVENERIGGDCCRVGSGAKKEGREKSEHADVRTDDSLAHPGTCSPESASRGLDFLHWQLPLCANAGEGEEDVFK